MTDAHEQDHTFEENILYPMHEPRVESEEFRENKHQLVKVLDLPCWLCGTKEKREVHHFHEWALWNELDPVKVLDTLRIFDPYGYTRQRKDTPIDSPDDIRNLIVLCELHHRGKDAGIHALTFPIWLARRAVAEGKHITKDSLIFTGEV